MSREDQIKLNVLPRSRSKDLHTALSEWHYTGTCLDDGNAHYDCELCSQPRIRYRFEIQNIGTGMDTMYIGSECIKQYTAIIVMGLDGRPMTGMNRLERLNEELKKRKLNEAISTLERWRMAEEDPKMDVTSMITYYSAHKMFSPAQMGLVAWKLQAHDVRHEPSIFRVRTRRASDRDQIARMLPHKRHAIRPYLDDDQLHLLSIPYIAPA